MRLNCSLVAIAFAASSLYAGALHAAGPAHSIVLPPVLVAESPATLAVLDATGRLVPDVEILLSDGHTIKTDASGRARWVVPAGAGELRARIQGSSIVATAPIEVRPTPAQMQVTDFPAIIDARDAFAIYGQRLQGDADENHVSIGGEAALVLAASPAALVALPAPDTPLGASQLSVAGNGAAPAPMDVTVVELDAINPAGPLRIGAPATLTVRVHGSTQPLEVELGNWSPTVIKMLEPIGAAIGSNAAPPDPNIRRMRTSGGEINQAQVQIVPLSSGKFYVRARLARARPAN
ncbi:MAG: hypothetical protein WA871_09060 [Candidatus Acidiferrales bacterium]